MDKGKEKELWEKCAAFHGHECGGLTIGYKAALYAMELLELHFSSDEQIVCISENDSCGNDAISVILGCSVGRGNLLFHITGKMAFTFFNRNTGKSVRLMLKDFPDQMSREEEFAFFQAMEPKDMYTVTDVKLALPVKAHNFRFEKCEICGEKAGENWMRIQGGRKVCLDCCEKYDRFNV